MQALTAGFPSLGWHLHPAIPEVGKQMGHEMCPVGPSLAHGGASWVELLTSSSSWTLQGEGTMRRVLAGAKNQWVHGLPWLSCMTFLAISLELECSREPVWGTLGTCTKVGSVTDLPGIAVGLVMQSNASGLSTPRSAGEQGLPCISKGCNKRENLVPPCHQGEGDYRSFRAPLR